MRRFVFRSPRLGFLAVGPALARPAAAFYRRNRAAFAPFDPVQPEDFFTEEGQAERLAEELVIQGDGRPPRLAEAQFLFSVQHGFLLGNGGAAPGWTALVSIPLL